MTYHIFIFSFSSLSYYNCFHVYIFAFNNGKYDNKWNGERLGEEQIILPKGGTNCLTIVRNRNVSENTTFIGLVKKTFNEECFVQWVKQTC